MWERAIDAVKESVSEKPEVAVAVVCGVELSSCPIPLVYDKLETRLRFVSSDFVRMRLFLEAVFFRG